MRSWIGMAAAALALAGCHDVVGLPGSQAQPITVSGQKMQVRVAPTEQPGVYRLIAMCTSMVVNPDSDLERQRGYAAARPYMQQQCRGPYEVTAERLIDEVNLLLV